MSSKHDPVVCIDTVRSAEDGQETKPELTQPLLTEETQQNTTDRIHSLIPSSNVSYDPFPCLFPALNSDLGRRNSSDSSSSTEEWPSVVINFPSLSHLDRSSEKHVLGISDMAFLAWALVLRAYVGSECVNFWCMRKSKQLLSAKFESQKREDDGLYLSSIDMPGDRLVVDLLAVPSSAPADAGSSNSSSEIAFSKKATEVVSNTVVIFHEGNDAGSDSRRLQQVDWATGLAASSDACLILLVDESNWHASLMYRTAVLDSRQACSVARTFTRAVSQLAHQPRSLVRDIDLLHDDDLRQLRDWNGELPEQTGICVQDLVTENVPAYRNNIAIESWDRCLTYEDLEVYSNGLASLLRTKHGIIPGTAVLTCFEKGAIVPVVFLALLKAGAICTPIEKSYPASRLAHIVQQCNANLVLTDMQARSSFHALDLKTVVVDWGLCSGLKEAPETSRGNAAVGVQPSDGAFIVFTSGSTGKPKCIVLEHGSIVASMRASAKAFHINHQTRALQYAAYTFAPSIEELFATLSKGGCVCIPSQYSKENDLAGFMNDYRVNWADLVPTIARTLEPRTLPLLRTLITGGEKLTRDILKPWSKAVRLINAYGPSECTINASYADTMMNQTDETDIGTPLGCRLWVVDVQNHDLLVPIGCIGELVIEGPIVARGYLNDDLKTKASFILNPAWNQKIENTLSSRMFKTGDLVRQNSDGRLSILGRKDGMVKYHGQRVDLTEIAQCICLSPSVERAVVVMPDTGLCQTRLVGVIQLKTADTPFDSSSDSLKMVKDSDLSQLQRTFASIKSRLSDQLPPYMVPSILVPVERMPLLASKKVDIFRVREWIKSISQDSYTQIIRMSHEEDLRKPTTEVEERLLKIWAEVLRVPEEHLSTGRSFANLGGDSIMAMRVKRQCRTQSLEVSIETIMRSSSLAEVAALTTQSDLSKRHDVGKPVQETESRVKDTPSVLDNPDQQEALEPGPIQEVYSCTPVQEGILMSQFRHPQQYMMSVTWEVSVRDQLLDISRFKDSWKAVVQNNSILKTVFIETSKERHGPFDQVVLKDFAPLIETIQVNDPRQESQTEENVAPLDFNFGRPLHRLRMFIPPGGKAATYIVCQIHISHALVDGASLSLIKQKLSQAYHEGSNFKSQSRFKDFIDLTQSQVSDLEKEYWMSYLNCPEPCNFPHLTDAIETTQRKISINIQTQDYDVLRGFCKRRGVTAFNVLQTAWGLVLSKYVGNTDICYGYSVSDRDVFEEYQAEIVGPCISVLAQRSKWTSDTTLWDALLTTKDDCLRSLGHRNLPLAQLHHLLGLKDQKLFNSVISFQRASTEIEDGNLQFQTLSWYDPTEFDITLNIEDTGYEIEIFLNYAVSCLNEPLAVSVAECFTQAVTSIIQKPTQTVGDVSLIGPRQLEDMMWINEANNLDIRSPSAIPGESCIHHVIEYHASFQPNRPAIDAWDKKYDYQTLNEVSSALALHLINDLGVVSGSKIAIFFGKSAYTLVAILAVLKAGGAYVPLEPSHPTDRLRMMIEEAEICVVLSGKAQFVTIEQLDSKAGHIVAVDDVLLNRLSVLSHGTASQTVKAKVYVGPNHTAYVLYTSGSTGKPKGVVMEHGSVCFSLSKLAGAFSMNADSRALQYSSLTFDMSVAEILGTLMVGGCVCIASDEQRMDDVTEAIRDLDVNWIFLTPTVSSLINTSKVPKIKTLIVGGEVVTKEHVSSWDDSVQVVPAYGPTETCVVTCVVDLKSESFRLGSLGKSVGGSNWVVDPNDYTKLAPVGCVGEIVISGQGVAQGYLAEPTKTAAAFLPEPKWLNEFPVARSGKVYRTGDLARCLPNVGLQYLGRKDSQVKIKGRRIELAEIEQHIVQFGWSNSSFAVEVCTPTFLEGQKLLTLFASSAQSSTGDGTENITLGSEDWRDLRKHLDNVLPEYMVPTLFVSLDTLPRSTAGKIDRRSLRNMVSQCSKAEFDLYACRDSTVQSPTNELEYLLRDCWGQILNIDPTSIGLGDSFLRLGGDSVAAIRLAALCREKGSKLGVASILKSKTLQSMALEMVKLTADPVARSQKPTEAKPDTHRKSAQVKSLLEDAYPCTPLQEGLMALSQSQPGTYVAQHLFMLPRSIDLDRFKVAWQTIFDYNRVLRTRILQQKNGKFLQAVLRSKPIDWNWTVTDDVATSIAANTPKMGYGTSLIQFSILQRATDSQIFFCLSIHHALFDGWSLPLILDSVTNEYNQDSRNLKRTLTNFAPYVEYLQRDDSASKAYWNSELKSVVATTFPPLTTADHSPTTNRFESRNVSLPTLSRSGKTLSLLIRAAWSMVLSKYTSTDDVVFGMTLSGRNAPIEGIISLAAPTITTVPVRVSIRSDQTLLQYLEALHQQQIDMIPHESFGLQKIKRISDSAKSACSFNNLLIIQPDTGSETHRALMVPSDEIVIMAETYGIVMECILTSKGVKLHAHYDDYFMNQQNMHWLLVHFEAALHWMCDSKDDSPLSEFSMTTATDITQMQEWNRYRVDYIDSTFHENFRNTVYLQPQAIAIESLEGRWSYLELYEQSSVLAAKLVTLGVAPETKVPVCMKKSPWAMIAIMAILIAGGAYVPLDPEDAKQRRETILRDTTAELVLVDPETKEKLSEFSGMCLDVNRELVHSLSGRKDWELPQLATSSNAAYVIYTSGSTGVPKGVVIEHGSLCTSAQAIAKAMFLDSSSRVYQWTAYTFDVSVSETLVAFMQGSCVCIPSEKERFGDIAGSMKRMNVNWAFFTPSVVALMRPQDLPPLDTLVLGGETVTRANVSEWAHHTRLVNGYGPTEATIFSCTGIIADNASPHGWIGRPIGGSIFIVDTIDYRKLAPIGCVGEMVIVGDTLARHYLNDEAKTAQVFVNDAPWVLPSPNTSSQRAYRTGDLGRFNADGTITHFGRKDSQVKVNGRRVELGEIESQISKQTSIDHCIVALPKTGPFAHSLTAIVELHQENETESGEDVPSTNQAESLEVFRGQKLKQVLRDLLTVETTLATDLPDYMLPSYWIPVRHMPRTGSGKLARSTVSTWVGQCSQDLADELMCHSNIESDQARMPADLKEAKILELWSQVLNHKKEHIALDKPFAHYGGDSITAINLFTKCKSAGLVLTVSDILKKKTIAKMAAAAVFVENVQSKLPTTSFNENFKDFQLSPIQQMYFESMADHSDQYNQSFVLAVTKPISRDSLTLAVQNIVSRHPMLRARFRLDSEGIAGQMVTQEVSQSFAVREHFIADMEEVNKHTAEWQKLINPFNGPLVSADLIRLPQQDILFMCAHHLVIDLVSWRIILQDMEDILSIGHANSEPTTSFHEWVDSQIAQNADTSAPAAPLPFSVPRSNYDYWGMQGVQSLHGNAVESSFTVDTNLSAAILGSANETFGTKAEDIISAALLISFSAIFNDRELPAIFTEGHGREPWDPSLDVSHTVGWFTTMFPVALPPASIREPIEYVRELKDLRRSMQDNGRPYFASRYHSKCGQEAYSEHRLMEVLFNFHGSYQQLEQDVSILRGIDETTARILEQNPVGPNIKRPSLIDIETSVSNQSLQVSIMWDSRMKHQSKLKQWPDALSEALRYLVDSLHSHARNFTLTDFPFYTGDFSTLTEICQKAIYTANIDIKQIEDVYPCSPLQSRMLKLKQTFPQLYDVRLLWQIGKPKSFNLSPAKVASGWQDVVRAHPLLRSTVAQDPASGEFHHVVLDTFPSTCSVHELREVPDTNELLQSNDDEGTYLKFGNHLSIYVVPEDRMYCKLRISHHICDHSSLQIIIDELTSAIRSNETRSTVTENAHREFVCSSFGRSSTTDSAQYWHEYLRGARPALFPTVQSNTYHNFSTLTLELTEIDAIQAFCADYGFTMANVVQTAWALVLRAYTNRDDTVFAYFVSGRDQDVTGIERGVGLFVNLLLSRLNFHDQQQGIVNIINQVQTDYANSLAHQNSCVEAVNDLTAQMAERTITNTVVNFHKTMPGSEVVQEKRKSDAVDFIPIAGRDPMEYDILVRVTEVAHDVMKVDFEYWQERISLQTMEEVAVLFKRVMHKLPAAKTVADLL